MVDPDVQELIHPSPDRRDWRRWLRKSDLVHEPDITRGQVFDTLEQGNAAAIAGHGISICDLAICAGAIDDGQLVLPFKTAVNTGNGYHLIWPDGPLIRQFLQFLQGQVPRIDYPDISYIKFG